MTRLTNYNNFVKGAEPKYNQVKPYIYVLKYILGKEDCYDELRDYILNYSDDNSDYEDDKTYDQFMKTLKIYAMSDKFDDIEECVYNHDEFEYDDFDETDDDFEEKMYYKDGFAKNQEVYFDMDNSHLSKASDDYDENDDLGDIDHSRIRELEQMEAELFDDEDLSDEDIDEEEFSDLEKIDNEFYSIEIEFKELNDSDIEREENLEGEEADEIIDIQSEPIEKEEEKE
jgi:hypothetical protein